MLTNILTASRRHKVAPDTDEGYKIMRKLHISFIQGNGEPCQKDFDVLPQLVSDYIFEKGHEKELDDQKSIISCLIWGCIGYGVNGPINLTSVKCAIELDDGNTYDVPQEVIHDIHRIMLA